MPSVNTNFQVCEVIPVLEGDVVDACVIERHTSHREQRKVWFDNFNTELVDFIPQPVVSDFNSTINCTYSLECTVCHYSEFRQFELKNYKLLAPIYGLRLGDKLVFQFDDTLYDDYHIECLACSGEQDDSCSVHTSCDSECEHRLLSCEGERSPPTAEQVYAAAYPEDCGDLQQPARLSITTRTASGTLLEELNSEDTLGGIIAQLERLARE